MWIAQTNKRGFLEVLGGQKRRYSFDSAKVEDLPTRHRSSDDVTLIWAEKPDESELLPNLIVTSSDQVLDFLAWASTYLESYRPFTALCRVIGGDSLNILRRVRERPHLGSAQRACAALTMAEVLIHGRGRIDVNSLNILSCESTLSFCRARAIALGLEVPQNQLATRWDSARKITGQPQRRPTAEDIEPVWDALIQVALPKMAVDHRQNGLFKHIVTEACRELHATGQVSRMIVEDLAQGVIDCDSTLDAMNGTREERVVTFEHALRRFSGSRVRRSVEASFFCGYLASLLNPGSLLYVKLVTSYLAEFPTLLLWYALCAGLHPQNGLLGEFGGLARRVLRDILMPETLLSRPQCDVSLDELEVLSKSRTTIETIPTSGHRTAKVEIVPMVNTVVRFPSASTTPKLSMVPSEVASWLGDLDKAADLLREILERQPGKHKASTTRNPKRKSS